MLAKPNNIPKTPGVYVFRKGQTPIYIGKAANLRSRLVSYFRKNAGAKVIELRREATLVEWIKLPSEIAALIKEAEMIKKHLPRFNILMRDDKNYFFVGFSRDIFPKIFVTHQLVNAKAKNQKSKVENQIQNSQFIGPFTSGSALYAILKMLRKVFPYCTCNAAHRRRCVNSQIGRCQGYCCDRSRVPTPEERSDYQLYIRHIKAVLMGKTASLKKTLKHALAIAVKDEQFERAAIVRDQMAAIENIFQHRLTLEKHAPRRQHFVHLNRVLQSLFEVQEEFHRVEAYDISNISGTSATGSMVVCIDGRPAKTEYRIFNIKSVQGISDVDMMKEVMRRRLHHREWQYPDLIVLDGGKPQLNAVASVMREYFKGDFPFILSALAKREEELYIFGSLTPIRIFSLPSLASNFFQHIRDEAHRFAKKQHHHLRKKKFQENRFLYL